MSRTGRSGRTSRDGRTARSSRTSRNVRTVRTGRGRRHPGELQLRQILLPEPAASPVQQVRRRFVLALLVMVVTILIVYLGRDGYHDNAHDHLDLLGSAYYATVTLSTTGYGDITPVSDGARLANILVITPLRVLFLIILVGTTLEVLTTRTRQLWRIKHWEAAMSQGPQGHVVVVGYGTKGSNAVETLLLKGIAKDRIVVVDPQHKAIEAANEDGLVGILGDATRTDVLRRAQVERAEQIIVGTQRDDTAVLVTLTIRQLNKHATVVVAVREDENAPLLRQSGATVVVTSSSSAGRLLGVSTLSPNAGAVLDDLLTVGNGLDVIDRPVTAAEVGGSPMDCGDLVICVVRGNRRLPYDDPEAAALQSTDRVIAIRRVDPALV
ncbi:potassium channel family protein [Streptacidiphilus carbonis]|uniref:potassium channel family protein n=1 Tax=Streptacidiphilus carbonis TaxID=105422 RepID=UPI0009FD1385|nr:potassium channel family protein [Streptacidiphilus carbonis]